MGIKMKKNIISILSLIIGMFFIIYYFALTSTMGPINFSKFLLLGGFLLCIYSFVHKALCENKVYKKIMKIIKPIFFIGLFIFISTEALLFGFSFNKNMDKADYTIVLGAGLRGEIMTITLKQRVDTALEYINSNEDSGYIVVSGGQGPGESITEAEAMKRYLVNNEVGDDIVLKEEQSTSTYENLEFSKKIIEEHSGKSIEDLNIKIITSGFHLFRSKMLCNSLGFGDVTFCASPIRLILAPNYYIREFIGFYKVLVFDIIFK